MAVKSVTRLALEELARNAQTAERRRTHFNLHPELTDPVQRLFNVLVTGTYVRPHRHLDAAKWELMAILAGRMVLLTFDDHGRVLDRIALDHETPVIEIPPGTWHTLAVLESPAVLLEVKPGPYRPAAPGEFAPWAPREGESRARPFEQWCHGAQAGDVVPEGLRAHL